MENVYNNAVDDFNSHAHVERDAIIHIHIAVNAYFNSHAHVERDIRKKTQKRKLGISTHTLTWSVTSAYCVLWRILLISTHTLTWSVTYEPS